MPDKLTYSLWQVRFLYLLLFTQEVMLEVY